MTQTNQSEIPIPQGVIEKAIERTPSWVWAFCGGMVTLSVCIVFVLQVGGFSSPLQRIMNAKAASIERAAESISASAKTIEDVINDVNALKDHVDKLEKRVDNIEDVHARRGVK